MNTRVDIGITSALTIRLSDVFKEYKSELRTVKVLQGVSLEVLAGDFVALMGPSGSGKTTLLNIIAGLDRATGGSIFINNVDIATMSDKALTSWRAENVGFVFQSNNLIPVLTAYQNVELPLFLSKTPKQQRSEMVNAALAQVGLQGRMGHYPRELSGGEEQRVAVARAIVHNPSIIVADEPTGSLDRENADEVLALFHRLNRDFAKTIVLVTHDPAAAKYATSIRQINKGLFA